MRRLRARRRSRSRRLRQDFDLTLMPRDMRQDHDAGRAMDAATATAASASTHRGQRPTPARWATMPSAQHDRLRRGDCDDRWHARLGATASRRLRSRCDKPTARRPRRCSPPLDGTACAATSTAACRRRQADSSRATSLPTEHDRQRTAPAACAANRSPYERRTMPHNLFNTLQDLQARLRQDRPVLLAAGAREGRRRQGLAAAGVDPHRARDRCCATATARR